MKLSKRDSTDEKRILTGMIVDTVFLGHVTDKWHADLFNSRWSNLIARWCVSHFRSYGRAPGKSIEALFESWAENQEDEKTVELIERFLSHLSGEYKQLAGESQSDYLIDRGGEYFNRVRASKLADVIQGNIAEGKVQEAVESIQKFDKLEMGVGAAVDILQDAASLKDAFERPPESLIKYPAALGRFFGNALCRDGLIALMGPEKRGKTFWLMDMAWRAMCQRRRVAFFAVGDMSQDQMIRRFAVRAAQRPLRAGKIQYPVMLNRDPDAKFAEPMFKEKEFTKALSWKAALRSFKKVAETKVKSKDSYLRMSVHPNSSINVGEIKSILAGWERSGWTPDIVVIDYADILAAPAGQHDDSRAQTNSTWKQLRALSQEIHGLVITATQSDAASYSADTVRRQHFSEDKRKLAHVIGLIGLNADESEQEQGLMRLNWIVLRESKFSESTCVHVAGCLDIANPALQSVF